MRTHTSVLAVPLLAAGLALLAGCASHRDERAPEPKEEVVASDEATYELEMPAPATAAPPPVVGNQMLVPPHDGDYAGGGAVGDTVVSFNTEEYDRIYENEFRSTDRDPLSTFAIDVDVASYGNVRRFLTSGGLPPKDAVRIEELVNYFDYDYPDPRGDDPFSITTETSVAPWNPAHRLVHVGIQGRRMDAADLPPANLVFLVDVSGSMNSPDKLPLVQQSLRLLVEQLREEDRVAMVVYAGQAGLVLPSTSGADRRAILDAIDRLAAGGSTAGGEGIRLAYRIARENLRRGGNNRVVLATDGDFNVGVSSDAELVRLIEEEREHGVFLTVLGYGTGNYKDGKMEQLTDHGNGNYAYIDGLAEARKVLVGEMGGTLLTIAKDVKVQIEFNPAKVKAYRLIGYENRVLAAEDFNDDRKDGGELGAGHSVTALYEVIPAGSSEPVRGTDPLRYQRVRPHAGERHGGELMMVKLRYKQPAGETSRLLEHPVLDRSLGLSATTEDFRFAAAVAAWGMLLRESQFRGSASYADVLRLARGALGDDRHGYRAEFVRLVEDSRRIAARERPADSEEEDVGGHGGH